jgi:glycosyltransferase 2 family protein
VRRVLRWLWLVLAVAALVWAIVEEYDEVRRALTALEPWRIAVSAAGALVGVGLSGQVWRLLARGVGSSLGLPATAQIFFVGQLGKYLPGSVWPVLAQMELGRDHGIAPRTSASAVALFLWVHLCTGGIVACLLLPLTTELPDWLLLGVPVGLLLVAPGLLGRVLSLKLRLLRRDPLPQLPTADAVAGALGWSAVMWMCYGLHVWVLAAGVEAVPATAPLVAGATSVGFWQSTGAFAAAWSLGFLFLIAPAGAGAREAALVGLLPLPAGAALVVAITSRLLLTLADGAWGSLGALSARRRR